LQLIFDNYTSTPHPSDAFPASSYSKKTPDAEGLAKDFSGTGPSRDFEDLCQQLQSMKKQVLLVMEQSRKATEREQVARRQAQEAMAAKEAAIAEANQATSRENSMLQLMNDSSSDMTGTLYCLITFDSYLCWFSFLADSSIENRFFFGYCCRRSTC
jgi:hypothetical protein